MSDVSHIATATAKQQGAERPRPHRQHHADAACRKCGGRGYQVLIDTAVPAINDTSCGGRCTAEPCQHCRLREWEAWALARAGSGVLPHANDEDEERVPF